MRSGFDIQIKATYSAVLFVALIPQLIEATIVAFLGVAFFGMDIDIAYVLGFTLAATGPGIILPCLATIVSKGYGFKHKIPNTLFVTCAFDEIFSIIAQSIAFAIVLNRAPNYPEKKEVWLVVVEVIGEILLGVACGILVGLCGYFFKYIKND